MPFLNQLKAALQAATLALVLSICALVVGLVAANARPAFAAGITVDAELGQRLVPAEGGKVYLRLSLKALRQAVREQRTPVNVALVLDRSGSMRGDRLASAKEAAREAVSRLGTEDFVSLIAYNHKVQTLSPSERLRSYSDLNNAIEALTANGRTALYAGVMEGSRQVERFLSERRVNRVILMSDGLANVGPSKPRELAELGQKLGANGISVTTIGLGLSYNEDLMQRLALASDGNHAFAERPEDLVKIFNSEFGDTLSIAAQDIEIIIECGTGFRPKRVLGRHADIDGSRVRMKLNQLTGGAERYLVVEMDAENGRSAGEVEVASVSVDYVDLDTGARGTSRTEVRTTITTDSVKAKDSLNKAVMSQVTAQIATEATERAVELRDRGDLAGARSVLQQNAADLKVMRKKLGSGAMPASKQMLGALNKLEEESISAAQNLDGDKWAKKRKELRYQQHKTKRQQTY